MTNYILFLLIILFTNIIQGITGFAGTILAMPPSLMLVGYPVAKPVLNVLGLLSGIYVFAGKHRSVCWKELKKIVAVMAAGIIGGILIKGLFAGKEQVLYKILGVFIIFLSVQGIYTLKKGDGKDGKKAALAARERGKDSPALYLLLVLAGIVHGIFVSGGPLLIGYLTKKIPDKVSFRATISTVWIFLNGMILADDIRMGLWNAELVKIQLISIPFLLAGMFIGAKLYARMSQKLFMMITYLLLFISGVLLLVK
ncbi:sulfite exporter TauE/SafE family protein [[Clostridium] symbiosum]|uniref:sulfite exporter TauE/SafE family protein n=1 Tax=Clostridium symbiosum TaxID=1512 RepID=UPI001D085B89|nr:sulfite exporter TauE/SafE family protein [[Clostridium] symbiosum]MCB6609429.1 sulfite exporter TauE/SafE family protein [[Clostridium] symbiosum]MCB6929199.1 sulfite exporter TauE/SafE family protein [[Clostridium] symbiosum]